MSASLSLPHSQIHNIFSQASPSKYEVFPVKNSSIHSFRIYLSKKLTSAKMQNMLVRAQKSEDEGRRKEEKVDTPSSSSLQSVWSKDAV